MKLKARQPAHVAIAAITQIRTMIVTIVVKITQTGP